MCVCDRDKSLLIKQKSLRVNGFAFTCGQCSQYIFVLKNHGLTNFVLFLFHQQLCFLQSLWFVIYGHVNFLVRHFVLLSEFAQCRRKSANCGLEIGTGPILVPRGRDPSGQRRGSIPGADQKDRGLWGRECVVQNRAEQEPRSAHGRAVKKKKKTTCRARTAQRS